MGVFEEFDKNIDVEGLREDVAEAAENGGNFKEVPEGDYEIKVDKIEAKVSKKGDPMLSIWFKIVAGEYKGNLIFYNQILSNGYGIHFANEMLRSFNSGLDIEFKNFAQYEQLFMDVLEKIDGTFEYALKYGKNEKGYNTYEITDVFEAQN